MTDWGIWKITDNQAEKIRAGNIEEYNSFFVQNYDHIKWMCRNYMKKFSDLMKSIEIDECINNVYLDLFHSHQRVYFFSNGGNLHRGVKYSVYFSPYGGITLLQENNPKVLCDGKYRIKPNQIVSMIFVDDEGEEMNYLDLHKVAPSPAEEIEAEENNEKLVEVLTPFLSPGLLRFLPFWLNGVSETHISEILNCKKSLVSVSVTNIKKKLILQYEDVRNALIENGYNIPACLLKEIPSKFDHYEELRKKQVLATMKWKHENKAKANMQQFRYREKRSNHAKVN